MKLTKLTLFLRIKHCFLRTKLNYIHPDHCKNTSRYDRLYWTGQTRAHSPEHLLAKSSWRRLARTTHCARSWRKFDEPWRRHSYSANTAMAEDADSCSPRWSRTEHSWYIRLNVWSDLNQQLDELMKGFNSTCK